MIGIRFGGRFGIRNSTGPRDLTVSSFAVTPSSRTIVILSQFQLSAIQTLSDATTRDVTSQARWTSSNPLIATVSVRGLLIAVAVGDTTITATFAGRSANSAVHVSLT